MNDVEHFALVILLTAAALVGAVVSNRISERSRIPAPAISCWPPRLPRMWVPTLGQVSVTSPVQRHHLGGYPDEASRQQPGEGVAGSNSVWARTPATRIAVSIALATWNGRRALLQRRSKSTPIPARPRQVTAPRIRAVSGVSGHGHNAMAAAGRRNRN